MKLKTSSFKSIFFIWSAALVLLHLAAALAPGAGRWGVDCWSYFSQPAVLILTAAGLIVILPVVAGRLAGFLFPDTGVLPGLFSGKRGWIAASAVSLAAGFAFWALRCRVHLLGDGYWWIRNLRGLRTWKNEPLSLYLDWLVSRIPAIVPVEISPAGAFQLVSCASGVVFVCTLILLSRSIGRRSPERALIFSGIITFGGLQLFAGYVETYPPQAAAVLLYIFFAWRMLAGKGRLFWPAAVFWICILLHLSSLFLLPSLLYLYLAWWNRDTGRKKPLRLILQFAAPAAAVLLLMFVIRLDLKVMFGQDEDNAHLFFPLLDAGSRYFSYRFLSLAHLSDLFNLVMLVSPFALPLSLLLAGRLQGLSSGQRFLLIASVFPLAFLLIFNPGLGYPRDWDIFVFAFIAPTLLGLTLLIDAGRENESFTRSAALMILVLGGLHTLPWVMVNASQERSLARYNRILDSDVLRSVHARAFACEEAAIYFREKRELDRSVQYYHRAIEADSTSYRIWGSLAGVLEAKGRMEEAEAAYRKALSIESGSLALTFHFAQFLNSRERFGDSVEYFRRAIDLDPRHSPSHWNLAVLYFKLSEYEKSRDEFERFLELEPDSKDAKENLEKLNQFLSGTN